MKPKARHPLRRPKVSKKKPLTAEEQERRRAYGRRIALEKRQRALQVAKQYGAARRLTT
jgi:hypothetical protein